jgi:hypothetical protein
VAHFDGFHEIALGNHFQPVRNIVVYRTFPLAVRIATFNTTIGLIGGVLSRVIGVYFVEFFYPIKHGHFDGIGAVHLEKLE